MKHEDFDRAKKIIDRINELANEVIELDPLPCNRRRFFSQS